MCVCERKKRVCEFVRGVDIREQGREECKVEWYVSVSMLVCSKEK